MHCGGQRADPVRVNAIIFARVQREQREACDEEYKSEAEECSVISDGY